MLNSCRRTRRVSMRPRWPHLFKRPMRAPRQSWSRRAHPAHSPHPTKRPLRASSRQLEVCPECWRCTTRACPRMVRLAKHWWTLLPVLLLGAGTDYGLFLVYRVREEIRRGSTPRDAVVTAMSRVGLSIAYSAATVIAALACLVLASFSLYQGLGPSLAVGVAVMLTAALTLLPALLAIFGRVLFWPSHPSLGQDTTGAWGRVATRVVRQPLLVLLA